MEQKQPEIESPTVEVISPTRTSKRPPLFIYLALATNGLVVDTILFTRKCDMEDWKKKMALNNPNIKVICMHRYVREGEY